MYSYNVFKHISFGTVFMQESSGAYARMSFDLEEVGSLICCSDTELVELFHIDLYLH